MRSIFFSALVCFCAAFLSATLLQPSGAIADPEAGAASAVELVSGASGLANAPELGELDDVRLPEAPLDVEVFLKRFHVDPALMLNARLLKRDEQGRVVREPATPLFKSGVRSKAYLIYRDEVRSQICRRAGIDCDPQSQPDSGPFSRMGERDRVEQFLSTMRILRKPVEMEKAGLLQMTLANQPWSDSFWPVNKGLIGRRYADQGYPDIKDWTANHNYIQSRPAWTVDNDTMAPSEKYDYLVGDRSWRLTDYMWRKGKRYVAAWGRVPAWVGLCHGWAPASIMVPAPKRVIEVRAANGSKVTFYPSDIKALASQIWGEAPPIVRFVGSRCKKFHPREDEVGRVTHEGCYDVNPGTWHMAVVNQIGVAKRAFVMDSTFDWEVWNYPTFAYQYRYFNPQTLAVSNRMQGSMIPIGDFTIDKFKRYRDPKARYVVGIAMDATYSIPTQPSRKVVNKQKHHTVRYVYDLELDENGEIIGGEWYSNFHPDFLWSPPIESRALAKVERSREEPLAWDGEGPVSEAIQKAAERASARGEPLGAVVETLIRLAAQTEEDAARGSDSEVDSERSRERGDGDNSDNGVSERDDEGAGDDDNDNNNDDDDGGREARTP